MVEADPEKMLAKMGMTGQVAAIVMIIFGILILIWNDLVAVFIGLYLLIVGFINLMGHMNSSQPAQGRRAPYPPRR